MTDTIEIDESPPVCTFRITNPDKRNAVTASALHELSQRLDSLAQRSDIRVIILTGAGDKAFCSGYDITELSTGREDRGRLTAETTRELREFPYPTIAMVNGDTVGAGMNLACACDIRIGVTGARFGVTPAKLGTIYSYDGISQLVDVIGPASTKELLFTGELISAERAEQIGLLNHLVDPAELKSRTDELATTIGSNAPLSLTGMKQIVEAITRKTDFSAAEREWAEQLRTEARQSRDHEEGKQAFEENRTPEFEGH